MTPGRQRSRWGLIQHDTLATFTLATVREFQYYMAEQAWSTATVRTAGIAPPVRRLARHEVAADDALFDRRRRITHRVVTKAGHNKVEEIVPIHLLRLGRSIVSGPGP